RRGARVGGRKPRTPNPDPRRPEDGFPADGCHYLQWTHTRHDRDFHNATNADLTVVLERLAAFERALYESQGTPMPLTDPARGLSGHVGVIKNFGRLVGGSLVHGHQQILHSNVLPRRIEDDRRFLDRHGRSFACYLAERNPPELTIREYDRRVRLVTPFFMKRPLEAMAIVLAGAKSYLHDLGPREIRSLARALSDVTRAATLLMPALGREVAYNLVFHTGPIGGLYVEMLPFTQPIGGYEQLGIYICVLTPEQSTRRYVELLAAPRGRAPTR
ncbi:MAG: hypothetical protein HY720_17015, partial [Planctomycetes bacterium]|nr:hypothetical protein [Planctomycetota bacterium]